MKSFLLKILLFLLPIAVLLIGIEVHFRNKRNPFAVKAQFVKENASDIEVMILGSSHHQNGLNPKYFLQKTCNLAFAAQDIKTDSALLAQNFKRMPKLKTVVFELDYHRVENLTAVPSFRYPWYYLYYEIELIELPWYNKISLYSSNPIFFNTNLMSELMGNAKQPQGINEFGYVESNYQSMFRDLGFDAGKIQSTSKRRLEGRHHELSDSMYVENKRRIVWMIDYCRKNNLKLYFLSSPLYDTYRQKRLKRKVERFEGLIADLQKRYNINYVNSTDDNRFQLKDFADDDHLNPTGARKYSQKIDSIILVMQNRLLSSSQNKN